MLWLLDPGRRDPSTPDLERGHLDRLVARLAASEATMPPRCCDRLGLTAGSSYGTAARWLSWAVSSPERPRCRSYRSAAFFVRGLVAGTDELIHGVRVHADAEVARTVAAALNLAYSERASRECADELRRSADAATLRAARESLVDHTAGDPELVDRARSLLADASVETAAAR